MSCPHDDGAALIRRLVRDDAAAYRALALAAYARHPDAFVASVAEREPLPLAWWEERVAAQFVAGAWVGERLVGCAGLAPQTRPKTCHKATLFGMFVDAAFTRRGIGEQLVDAVLARATSEPALRVVQLTVSDTNAAARSLYERCGFVAFGVEPLAIVDGRGDGTGFIGKAHMWLDLERRGAPARREACDA